MGKKPVLVIFFSLLVVLSFVQFRADVRSANLKSYEISLVKRERSIRLLASLTESLTLTGRRDLVEGHLADAIRVNWIDFYMMTYDDEVMLFDTRRPLSKEAFDTISDLHPPEAFWEFDSKFESVRSVRGPAAEKVGGIENFSFFEADLGGNRRLKLGFNRDREAFLAETTAYSESEDRRMYVLSLLIVMGVFLFAARDLLRVAKAIRTKGVRGLKDIRVFSKEASALQQGLEGYGEAVDRLQSQNKTLVGQVLPSLRSELQSGKAPPYDFNCTMVRTDINNFTKIFHSYPVDEFLATINEFFTECSHVISRYDGFIHEFVGDEIIFYFKDEQHTNSFTAALACTREMELVAERIHAHTSEARGYAFRVKSSLAYGKIRFGPLLNGFSLAGGPLIETTRILSAVNEKNENTIHFDSPNVFRLYDGIEFTESFKTHLKGMEGERTVMRYSQHVSVETAKLDSLRDYRSDLHLAHMLNTIAANPASLESTAAIAVIGTVHVTRCQPDLMNTLLMTIEQLLKSDRTVLSTNRAISKLAEALPRLVPPTHIEMFVDVIVRLTEDPDLRIVANSIETLQAFRSVGATSRRLDGRLLESKNTRVVANALVFLGTAEVSNIVIKRLRKLISSTDSNQVAAGIFAWGEIASHHLNEDPVYFRTQSDFLALAGGFENAIVRSPSASSHATEAALKAGDTALARRLSSRACA